jgi:hypothetical protein
MLVTLPLSMAKTFGDSANPEVLTYEVTPTANGFRADYLSTVSNYPKHLKHLNPPGFKWRRLFASAILRTEPQIGFRSFVAF